MDSERRLLRWAEEIDLGETDEPLWVMRAAVGGACPGCGSRTRRAVGSVFDELRRNEAKLIIVCGACRVPYLRVVESVLGGLHL